MEKEQKSQVACELQERNGGAEGRRTRSIFMDVDWCCQGWGWRLLTCGSSQVPVMETAFYIPGFVFSLFIKTQSALVLQHSKASPILVPVFHKRDEEGLNPTSLNCGRLLSEVHINFIRTATPDGMEDPPSPAFSPLMVAKNLLLEKNRPSVGQEFPRIAPLLPTIRVPQTS